MNVVCYFTLGKSELSNISEPKVVIFVLHSHDKKFLPSTDKACYFLKISFKNLQSFSSVKLTSLKMLKEKTFTSEMFIENVTFEKLANFLDNAPVDCSFYRNDDRKIISKVFSTFQNL